MCGELRGEDGARSAGTNSAWIRRHLSDSIYIWACGEKADDADDEPQSSDKLISWLILLMQGFTYTMLVLLARVTSNSDAGSSANDSHESHYLLPSVTGAMYLLVASTTHDLRAGYSLLVDGSCAGHRAFGIGLLLVYGIMVTAAMTVLVSTCDDSASVVLNAVTVLFVADLDEKALKFLSAVPQKWRLFWALESIATSFALALIAIFYIGDDSSLLEGNSGVIQNWPKYYIWLLNPVAVTLSSFLLSFTLQSACELFSEACVSVDEPTVGLTVTRVFASLFAAINRAKDGVRGEPCFYVALTMWLVDAVVCWFFLIGTGDFPVALDLYPTAAGNEDVHLVITENKVVLLYSNAVFVTGLAAKALGVVVRRKRELDVAIAEPNYYSRGEEARERCGRRADSRVPSLLVGWGIGFWVTSLLYVLVCSWDRGECGWSNAPTVVTLISYAILPCFVVCCIIMVAETNFLGTRFGVFVKPAADRMRNLRRIEYWIMASVFRDILVLWVRFCLLLTYALHYYL